MTRAKPKEEHKPRPIQPKCVGCSHVKSFHGTDGGACKALGCKCASWLSPEELAVPAVGGGA